MTVIALTKNSHESNSSEGAVPLGNSCDPDCTCLQRGVSLYCDHLNPVQWHDHSHNEMEILIPLDSAECDFSWSTDENTREQHRLVEGEVCLIGPQKQHSANWLKPAHLVMLHIKPSFVKELGGLPFNAVSVDDFAGIARDDLVIWEILRAFRNIHRRSQSQNSLYLESLATVFATHILRAHSKHNEPHSDRRCLTPSQLRKATDFIHGHLKDSISIKEIAAHVHLSPFHFIRLFKGSIGLTPHQYLLKCRVLRAQELLRTGNYRVAEVAYEVGFCDQSHLDRHFRRHFGFPPKLLLKQHLAQQ